MNQPSPKHLLLADVLGKDLGATCNVLDRMLVDYQLVQTTVNTGYKGGSGGAWGALMPATWTRSYETLDHLLRLLRKDGPEYVLDQTETTLYTRKLYWWVAEFYFRHPRVQRTITRTTKHRKGGSVEVDAGWQVQAVRPDGFEFFRVREGLEWLEEHWSAKWSAQPHYLSGKDWERLLSPAKAAA